MENAKKRAKDPTASYSLGRKVLCVVLSAVLFGFGWPAINPIEVLAADNAAAGDSKPAATSESATQSGAASADAAASAASGTQAQADSAADQKAAATDAAASQASGSASAGEQQATAQSEAPATQAASSSQQAAATEQGTVVIGLKFANASILPDGDTEAVGAPATKLTVPQNDYKFTVVPDEGYKVDKVTYNDKDLSAGANGVYVIGATELADGATLSVSAVKDEAQESKAVESTPIEKTDDGSNEVADGVAPFAATDAKGSSADYTVEAGKTVNVSGAWGNSHKWSVISGNDYASLSNTNGQTVVVAGKSAGSVTLKHQYSRTYGPWSDETWYSETFTVEVTAPAPVTEITISGADSVKQFESIALSSNVSSNVVWSSSDESIAKVDGSGKVTGVNVGEAIIYATTTGADGSQLKAEHKVTVTANVSSAVACVFFVKSATTNPASNDSSDWYPTGGGDNATITANINIAGLERRQGNANWDYINGKNFNLYTSVASRFVSFNDSDYIEANGTLKTGTYYWNVAFDAFKSQIGENVTVDDVKSIKLIPYKISYYNDGSQSRKFHLDCTVVVEAKNAITATYYLWDAGANSFEWFDAATYKTDGAVVTVPGSSKDNEKDLPSTKVVNGKTYKLLKWYTNEALSSNEVKFPTQIGANANYYAKYLSVSNTCTVNYLVKDADGNVVGQAKPSEIRNNLTAGQTVTEVAPSIDGYTHIDSDEATKSITVSDTEDNVINFYYTQSDYSYTIKYVWNNTNEGDEGHLIKASDPVTVKSGSTVSLTDDQLAVDGYTIVPNQSTEYIIDANNKVIEIKYYKNVDLTAKSDEGLTYNGEAQTVSGYTGAPEGVTFEGVTASGTQTNAGEYKDEVKFAKESGEVVGAVDSSAKYIVKSATPGSMKIDQAEVVVKANAAEKTYGDTDPAFTAEVTGLVGDDKNKAADLIKYEVSRTNDAEAAGTYKDVIEPKGDSDQGNYKVTYQPADFTIKAKAIDFTVDALKDVVYNGEDQKQSPSSRTATRSSPRALTTSSPTAATSRTSAP